MDFWKYLYILSMLKAAIDSIGSGGSIPFVIKGIKYKGKSYKLEGTITKE